MSNCPAAVASPLAARWRSRFSNSRCSAFPGTAFRDPFGLAIGSARNEICGNYYQNTQVYQLTDFAIDSFGRVRIARADGRLRGLGEVCATRATGCAQVGALRWFGAQVGALGWVGAWARSGGCAWGELLGSSPLTIRELEEICQLENAMWGEILTAVIYRMPREIFPGVYPGRNYFLNDHSHGLFVALRQLSHKLNGFSGSLEV